MWVTVKKQTIDILNSNNNNNRIAEVAVGKVIAAVVFL